MKLDKVKKNKGKVSSGKNLFKKIVSVVLSIAVFAGSYYVIYKISIEAQQTVTVMRISAKDGLPAESVLTKDNLVEYPIILREYTEDMVKTEDKNDAYERFTTNYMRNGAILHKDEFIDIKPLKDIWLYTLNEEVIENDRVRIIEKEVLTIPFNYLESGGDILTPGDRIRIRVRYDVEETEIEEGIDPWTEEPYSRPGKTITVEKSDILFDIIEVTDMLNSKSHSIYEVYREVLRYPESERQKMMKSKDFLSNIVPKALVVSATAEQVEKYMQYRSRSKGILITILQRDRDTIILDLPILQMEMELWKDNQ